MEDNEIYSIYNQMEGETVRVNEKIYFIGG